MAEGAAAPGFVHFGLADGLAGPALELGHGLQDFQDVAELLEGGLRQELLHLLPELFLQAAGVLRLSKVRVMGVSPCWRMIAGMLSRTSLWQGRSFMGMAPPLSY